MEKACVRYLMKGLLQMESFGTKPIGPFQNVLVENWAARTSQGPMANE